MKTEKEITDLVRSLGEVEALLAEAQRRSVERRARQNADQAGGGR